MASQTVVLVHGGFVDGSGWRGVYDILRKDGYDVSVVQNPTLSLEGDVAATKSIIDAQDACSSRKLDGPREAPRASSGAGRALRSSLPFTFSGNASRMTKAEGTMYSGRRAARNARRIT